MSVYGSLFTGLAEPYDKNILLPIMRSRRSQYISYINNMSITVPNFPIFFSITCNFSGKINCQLSPYLFNKNNSTLYLIKMKLLQELVDHFLCHATWLHWSTNHSRCGLRCVTEFVYSGVFVMRFRNATLHR